MKNGEKYSVVYPANDTFKLDLLESGVEIQVSKQTYIESIQGIIMTLPIFLLVFFIVYYFSRHL